MNDYGIDIDRLYDINIFINDFSKYFKYDIYEIMEFLDKSVVVVGNCKYTASVNYLKKYIEILSKKAKDLLDLILYLKEGKYIKDKENILENLKIYHYGSILKGEDIVIIFDVFKNILNEYKIKRDMIMGLDKEIVDSFMLCYGRDDIYPVRSLVNDSDRVDKTSIMVKRKRNL